MGSQFRVISRSLLERCGVTRTGSHVSTVPYSGTTWQWRSMRMQSHRRNGVLMEITLMSGHVTARLFREGMNPNAEDQELEKWHNEESEE